MERMLCPRVHFKCIIVDGVKAYFGSANLTGAGMGAKSEKKRNFENGVLTDKILFFLNRLSNNSIQSGEMHLRRRRQVPRRVQRGAFA